MCKDGLFIVLQLVIRNMVLDTHIQATVNGGMNFVCVIHLVIMKSAWLVDKYFVSASSDMISMKMPVKVVSNQRMHYEEGFF